MSLSIKNGIQLLSLLNMVNVPVVLMQLQLSSVSIRLFLAIPYYKIIRLDQGCQKVLK